MTPGPERRWISPRECGIYLGGFSTKTIRSWIARGEIGCARLGHRLLIDKKALDKKLEAQVQTAPVVGGRRGAR
jgi:excisionase family DNA binding protein